MYKSTGFISFVLRRFTGVVLVLYLFTHMLVIGSATQGKAAFDATLKIVQGPAFKIMEIALDRGGGLSRVRRRAPADRPLLQRDRLSQEHVLCGVRRGGVLHGDRRIIDLAGCCSRRRRARRNIMRIFQMQRVSAIALLIFLGIHMAVMHYPPWEIDFRNVVVIERLSNPIWKVIDIAFLFFVLMHALAGAYVVLTDIQRVNAFKRVLAGAAIVLGIVAFIYGTVTIMAFQPPV